MPTFVEVKQCVFSLSQRTENHIRHRRAGVNVRAGAQACGAVVNSRRDVEASERLYVDLRLRPTRRD